MSRGYQNSGSYLSGAIQRVNQQMNKIRVKHHWCPVTEGNQRENQQRANKDKRIQGTGFEHLDPIMGAVWVLRIGVCWQIGVGSDGIDKGSVV